MSPMGFRNRGPKWLVNFHNHFRSNTSYLMSKLKKKYSSDNSSPTTCFSERVSKYIVSIDVRHLKTKNNCDYSFDDVPKGPRCHVTQ